jgi:hypothetical protein
MPLHQVALITVAVCDLCNTSGTHSSSVESPLARDAFEARGWGFGESSIDNDERPADAFCPDCAGVLVRHSPAPIVLKLSG